MTLSARTELSHNYSFDSKVDAMFKITIVAEQKAQAKGFHHILMIDMSRSMAGEKIELAKKGAQEYVKALPPGNTLSVILFSTTVETFPQARLSDVLPRIQAKGLTALFSALQSAFEIAKKNLQGGWIVLLTDGEPTDVTKADAYSKMKIPQGYQMIEFGVGNDYNQTILKSLADASGGKVYDVTEGQQFTLPDLMQKSAVNEVAAKNVVVDFGKTKDVRILNYKGPPVVIGAIEATAKIWGRVPLPAGFNGRLLDIQVTYEDVVSNSKKKLNAPVEVRVAKNDEQFVEGINNNLASEFQYYQGLEEYYQHLAAGDMKEATRTLDRLSVNAEQTRRADFIEATKRLAQEQEQTLRIGGVEGTKRLLKKVASETTQRTRGK